MNVKEKCVSLGEKCWRRMLEKCWRRVCFCGGALASLFLLFLCWCGGVFVFVVFVLVLCRCCFCLCFCGSVVVVGLLRQC